MVPNEINNLQHFRYRIKLDRGLHIPGMGGLDGAAETNRKTRKDTPNV